MLTFQQGGQGRGEMLLPSPPFNSALKKKLGSNEITPQADLEPRWKFPTSIQRCLGKAGKPHLSAWDQGPKAKPPGGEHRLSRTCTMVDARDSCHHILSPDSPVDGCSLPACPLACLGVLPAPLPCKLNLLCSCSCLPSEAALTTAATQQKYLPLSR